MAPLEEARSRLENLHLAIYRLDYVGNTPMREYLDQKHRLLRAIHELEDKIERLEETSNVI